MRALRLISLSLLCLLTFATPAAAECAWVLWGDQYESTARKFEAVQWKRYFVYPTYDACWARITQLTAGVVHQPGSWTDTLQRWLGNGQYRSGAIAHRAGDTVVIVMGEQSAHWTCYPDTIDPRGPKGSGR